jgi:septum formation protein
MQVILASTSPRRRALLTLLGVPFDVCVPTCDERMVPGLSAVESVAYFAQAKTHSVSKDHPAAVVLGGDTLIEFEGAPLGKPADLEEARTMLRRLAGRRHEVHTAVTVSCPSLLLETTQLSTAHVAIKPYDPALHERYLATGDSLGKAGAYSIQGPGRELIERLDGDFTTVVGLPLRLTAKLLRQLGIELQADVERLYETTPYENWAEFTQRRPSPC